KAAGTERGRVLGLDGSGYRDGICNPVHSASLGRLTTQLSSGGRAECREAPETRIAAAVCLYVHFCSRPRVESILNRGVARRSFGLLRCDLLLQIDPSASGPRAGYILRQRPLITSFLSVRRSPEDPRGYGPFLPPRSCSEGPMLPHAGS